MSDFPLMPELHDVAVVFTPQEISALQDAILIYDLMYDGCIADAIELMDRSDDGGYNEAIWKVIVQLRDKLDDANRANRRITRRWMDRVKDWREENGLA